MNAMVLGLSHSFSRYKLKFSPDKVDTMIIQAIGTFNERIKEAGNSPGYRNIPEQRRCLGRVHVYPNPLLAVLRGPVP